MLLKYKNKSWAFRRIKKYNILSVLKKFTANNTAIGTNTIILECAWLLIQNNYQEKCLHSGVTGE